MSVTWEVQWCPACGGGASPGGVDGGAELVCDLRMRRTCDNPVTRGPQDIDAALGSKRSKKEHVQLAVLRSPNSHSVAFSEIARSSLSRCRKVPDHPPPQAITRGPLFRIPDDLNIGESSASRQKCSWAQLEPKKMQTAAGPRSSGVALAERSGAQKFRTYRIRYLRVSRVRCIHGDGFPESKGERENSRHRHSVGLHQRRQLFFWQGRGACLYRSAILPSSVRQQSYVCCAPGLCVPAVRLQLDFDISFASARMVKRVKRD